MKTICPAHVWPFDGQRLFYLDDEIGLCPDIRRSRDDLSSVLLILLVADAAALSRSGLDKHAMSATCQFLDSYRRQGDPRLVRLDLIGHANTTDGFGHGSLHCDKEWATSSLSRSQGMISRCMRFSRYRWKSEKWMSRVTKGCLDN